MILLFLQDLFAVEHDGERTLVFNRYCHVRTEDPGLYDRDLLFAGTDDVFIKVICQIRGTRVNEGRAVAMVAVGIKRELGNEKQASADIGKA